MQDLPVNNIYRLIIRLVSKLWLCARFNVSLFFSHVKTSLMIVMKNMIAVIGLRDIVKRHVIYAK